MDSLNDIQGFCKNISKKAKGVTIDDLDIEILEMQLSKDRKKFKQLDENRIVEFRNKYAIELSEEMVRLFYLSSSRLSWRRPETSPKEGYLAGGFAFNGLTDIFASATPFWQKSAELFSKFESEKLIDYELLKELRWIESPTPFLASWYTPQFGCVRLEKGKFPDQFYFYDSGLVYPLGFKSYDEYIQCMINSAAVTGWQYFYIDPNLIISKNAHVKYITWSLHANSHLESGLDKLAFKEDVRIDRLDLLNEYFERCVRLLPDSFPFIDFSQHREFYARFQEAYYNR